MRFFLSLLLCFSALTGAAQAYPPEGSPQLEFAMQLRVKLGQTHIIGDSPLGKRQVVDIMGGTFEGPQISGTVLRGGADYQLITDGGQRSELNAVYCIKTADGTVIQVENRGLVVNTTDSEGKATFYFKTTPHFEAPTDSQHAWLNNAVFVCEPAFPSPSGIIVLNVWRVM